MTTKLGFITDLHADLGALQAALAQLDSMGVDGVVCGGDIVDGGDGPEQTIALLREREIPCIRGNHDRWAAERHDRGDPAHQGDERPLPLQDATVEWLRGLPETWSTTIGGVRVVACHGTPMSDSEGIHPDEDDDELAQWLAMTGARVLLCGHTHVPVARTVATGSVLNPGALWRGAEAFQTSLGAPEELSAAARHVGGAFGVLELPSRRWSVHHVGGEGSSRNV